MYKVRGLVRWFVYVFRYGWPKKIYFFLGGLGDQLLCTAVARELSKRGLSSGIWWFTDYARQFYGTPDMQPLIPSDRGLFRCADKFGVPVINLAYETVLEHDKEVIPPREHLIAALCRQAGIEGEVTLRPYWPHGSVMVAPDRAQPRVVLHSSCLNARFPMPNKQWPLERLQQMVDVLAGEVEFVQIGDSRDPLLSGVEDRRGCDIGTAADILRGSDLFLGMVGFLMHLARATDCPAVIIYGGREPAVISGYSCNANLESHPPCSPCWYNERCEHNRTCLADISVDQVVGEVRRMLADPPSRPLVCDYYSIN